MLVDVVVDSTDVTPDEVPVKAVVDVPGVVVVDVTGVVGVTVESVLDLQPARSTTANRKPEAVLRKEFINQVK